MHSSSACPDIRRRTEHQKNALSKPFHSYNAREGTFDLQSHQIGCANTVNRLEWPLEAPCRPRHVLPLWSSFNRNFRLGDVTRLSDCYRQADNSIDTAPSLPPSTQPLQQALKRPHEGHESDILFLKHGSSIIRQSSYPVFGSWKSRASSLWAKQHRA